MNAKELRQHHGTQKHANARQMRSTKIRSTVHHNSEAASSLLGDSEPYEAIDAGAGASLINDGPEFFHDSPNDTAENHDEAQDDTAWADPCGSGSHFSAGDAYPDPMAESLARALRDAGLADTWQGNDERPLHEEDDVSVDHDDSFYCEGPNTDAKSSRELLAEWFGDSSEGGWFPYPDKALFLTDLLFNSPRLRFSRAQQQAILLWARELGADVPSYDRLRKCQAVLKEVTGDPTTRQESGRGNVWYLNEIGDAIAKDISNPVTRANMTFYPEDLKGRLGEVWHGTKMLEDVPDHILSPMVRHGCVDYYVDELVKCKDGSYFLPKRWVRCDGSMHAVGHSVQDSAQGLVVFKDSRRRVNVDEFAQNIEQILAISSGIFPFAPESGEFAVSHPLRTTASGRMVYSVPLVVFIDDVSGNQSKQWNKHFSCYMSNGALPRTKLESEFHVRFVATSPNATPLEIMQGVRASIEKTFADPIVAWDCQSKKEVLLRPYALLFAGDNPMQAELCSCAGLNANHPCRTCKAGGTQYQKKSDEGFAKMLKPGELRNSESTTNCVFNNLMTSLQPNVSTTLTNAVRETGVKDALAQPVIDHLVKLGVDLRKASPTRAAHTPDEVMAILTAELLKAQNKGAGIINPLTSMDGVKIHEDTPTEILHTILLGIVKYFWGQTVWLLMKNKHFDTFQARLNSIVSDGLNVPKIPADYMCHYRGGLIGKHFKTISQVMAFTVYDLVPREVLDAWLVMGRLTVLLWHTEIEDLNSYIEELEACIDDFINVTCLCSPSILLTKPKFHFLVHLPFYIRRFGPAILFSTERYESYNAVFRGASIYSNKLAPSRDIAWSFAGIDRVKHIATGGWWKDHRTAKWTHASSNILRHIAENPRHAYLLGLPSKVSLQPGFITRYPLRSLTLAQASFIISDSLAIKSHLISTRDTAALAGWSPARAVTASSGDLVSVGDFAIVRTEGGEFSPLGFGLVREILADPAPNTLPPKITVQLFVLDMCRHTVLDMPTVTLTDSLVLLHSDDIVSSVNLQHDCRRGRCETSGTQILHQEREATTQHRTIVKHNDHIHFIINTQSLHNYRHIAHAIPLHLRGSSFRIADPIALRRQAASMLRDKKQQQTEARKAASMAIAMGRAQASSNSAIGRPSVDEVDPTSSASTEVGVAPLATVMEEHTERPISPEPHPQTLNNPVGAVTSLMLTHGGTIAPSNGALQEHHDTEPRHPYAVESRTQPHFPSGHAVFLQPVANPNGQAQGNTATALPTTLGTSRKDVLQHFCRIHKIPSSGNKPELLERLLELYNGSRKSLPSAADIATAYAACNAKKLALPSKDPPTASKRRRENQDENDDDGTMGQPSVQRRRGAVDEGIRLANEDMLRAAGTCLCSFLVATVVHLNMGLFDKVIADIEAAKDHVSRAGASTSHQRTPSIHNGLNVLAAAVQMTPQRQLGSASPQRQHYPSGNERTSPPLFDPPRASSPTYSDRSEPQPATLRRPREEPEDAALEEPARKRREMEEFTRDLFAEYEISAAERTKILGYSQLSPRKIMMVSIIRNTQAKEAIKASNGSMYLASKDFKENRHIRLNPGDYSIPPDLVPFATSAAFESAVSKALTNIRSEIKRQLVALWKNEKDICLVVKALAKKTKAEPTDAIWGRWAWVQMKLVDFSELVKSKKQDEEKFWDWLDAELAGVREQYQDEEPAQRVRSINL
ncbi:hypothetical protein HWV62_11375 [Athelia sp. TMB]|nr:hypothetical protein HWV62_11375 [Athelia sp. TMB]